MAIITISTHDDEEARLISDILEQLEFSIDVDIKYDDDLK